MSLAQRLPKLSTLRKRGTDLLNISGDALAAMSHFHKGE